MIAIVRMHSRVSQSKCWNFVAQNKERLQEALGDKGLLLYLTQRVGKDDTSLFLHAADPDFIGSFISEQLADSHGIDGIWMIPLFEPRFYPVPRNFENMMRYALSLRVAPNDMHGARVGLEQMTNSSSRNTWTESRSTPRSSRCWSTPSRRPFLSCRTPSGWSTPPNTSSSRPGKKNICSISSASRLQRKPKPIHHRRSTVTTVAIRRHTAGPAQIRIATRLKNSSGASGSQAMEALMP